jgi:hypothetical protein
MRRLKITLASEAASSTGADNTLAGMNPETRGHRTVPRERSRGVEQTPRGLAAPVSPLLKNVQHALHTDHKITNRAPPAVQEIGFKPWFIDRAA